MIKYGLPVAHITQTIAAYEVVHSSNARTNLSDLDEYDYQPEFAAAGRFSLNSPQPGDHEVQIYRRANGDVEIRNELWILPTVDRVNGIARQILQRFIKETGNAAGT